LNSEYNKLCAQMRTLISTGQAPRGSVAPRCIETAGLFDLDVDDEIWQDVELDDDEAAVTEPPLWLSNDEVRNGIKAVLELDRAKEEEIRLCKEWRSMQVWFAEEWAIHNLAVEQAGTFTCAIPLAC
jgi:hypothetical protein